jgi:hypothetical protein
MRKPYKQRELKLGKRYFFFISADIKLSFKAALMKRVALLSGVLNSCENELINFVLKSVYSSIF